MADVYLPLGKVVETVVPEHRVDKNRAVRVGQGRGVARPVNSRNPARAMRNAFAIRFVARLAMVQLKLAVRIFRNLAAKWAKLVQKTCNVSPTPAISAQKPVPLAVRSRRSVASEMHVVELTFHPKNSSINASNDAIVIVIAQPTQGEHLSACSGATGEQIPSYLLVPTLGSRLVTLSRQEDLYVDLERRKAPMIFVIQI